MATHPIEYGNRPALSTAPAPAFSIPSIIAIICAIASFMVGAGLGFILAILAIVAGLIGVLLSLSPRVRGGMISIFSVVAGVIGIVAAVFKLVF
jgi:hypothetical protein